MIQNNVFGAPKTLELDHFVFNPISTINPINPNQYLINREDYEIKEEMNKWIKGFEENAQQRKLIPKNFMQAKQDGKEFLQKNEEKSIIVTRITSHQLKICELIDEFWHILTKSPSSNEQIDYCREKKLFSEFIVRFSRNYLYELERNIDEIRFYEMDHYSYFERCTNHLVNKVCNLFTVIVRGLQTYKKYLPNLGNKNPDKLPQFMELLIHGLDLCIKMKIFDQDDLLIKMLKEKAHGFITVMNQAQDMPSSLNRFQTFDATSTTKHISIPMTPRYDMYDSKSKKMKQSKSVMNFSKTSPNPKNGATTRRSPGSACSMWRQDFGNCKMYELQDSLTCRGISSDCDAHKVAMIRSKNDPDMKSLKDIQIESNFAVMNFDEVIEEASI